MLLLPGEFLGLRGGARGNYRVGCCQLSAFEYPRANNPLQTTWGRNRMHSHDIKDQEGLG